MISDIVGYNSGETDGFFTRGTPCGAIRSKNGISFVVVTIDEDRQYVVPVADLEELALDIGNEDWSEYGRTSEDS